MKAYGRCSMCNEDSKIMSINASGNYYCNNCTVRYSQAVRDLVDLKPKKDGLICSSGILNEKYEDIRNNIPKYEDLD